MDFVVRDASALTLFCFPCAGASATCYLRWRRLVPSWLRIEPVEPPGRGLRMGEPALRDYDAAIDDLTAQIVPQVQTRYALFGHSMGALLAYGCAHRLIQSGAARPITLAVAATAAPSCRPPRRGQKKSLAELMEDLRRFKSVPDALFNEREMLRATLEVLAADYDVCESFQIVAREPLPGPVLIYGGAHDSVSESQLSAWRAEGCGRSRMTMFESGHFFLREQEASFLHRLIQDLSAVDPVAGRID